jgi:hypothetical protein
MEGEQVMEQGNAIGLGALVLGILLVFEPGQACAAPPHFLRLFQPGGEVCLNVAGPTGQVDRIGLEVLGRAGGTSFDVVGPQLTLNGQLTSTPLPTKGAAVVTPEKLFIGLNVFPTGTVPEIKQLGVTIGVTGTGEGIAETISPGSTAVRISTVKAALAQAPCAGCEVEFVPAGGYFGCNEGLKCKEEGDICEVSIRPEGFCETQGHEITFQGSKVTVCDCICKH